ncbi:MAG: hypothetical protein WAM58_23025, partial [Candidatus Acidiferrum sp.]
NNEPWSPLHTSKKNNEDHSSERKEKYAQEIFDRADIVRDGVAVSLLDLPMPAGLQRLYGQGHLHLITFSCYRRLPLLKSARAMEQLVELREKRTRTDSD